MSKDSQKVMKKLVKQLLKLPGVELKTKEGTPIYYMDPLHPGQIIQETDGKKVTGHLNPDGSFHPVKSDFNKTYDENARRRKQYD